MNHKQILIVDDEEPILVLLKESLTELGLDYQVMTLTDGQAALAKIMKQPFDLVITDFHLARLNGLDLLEAVNYAQPEAKVIVITGYGNDIIEAEARRLEAAYLTKPLRMKQFQQLVQEALNISNLNQENVYGQRENSDC